MAEQISRLMDGELEGAEADAAYRELKQPEGVETWVCYHVIGDTLRRTSGSMPGFSERFTARLGAEPTVLAPQPTAMANAREAAAVRSAQAKPQPVSPDYLLAHQEYSPTTQIQGVGPYLRSVAAGGADGRP